VKTAAEKPNVWYIIVTLIAMFYLSYFTSIVVVAIYVPILLFSAIIFSIGLAFVWAFLIWDLIKQVSLFFRGKAK
jgi:hypothetical protein